MPEAGACLLHPLHATDCTDIPPYSLNNSHVFYFVAECPEVTVLVEDVCTVQATKPSYVTRT